MAGQEQVQTSPEDPQRRIQAAFEAGARVVTHRVEQRIGHDPFAQAPDGKYAGPAQGVARDKFAKVPTVSGTPYVDGRAHNRAQI